VRQQIKNPSAGGFSTIIMAAGMGKRMFSKTPKILHPILGKCVIQFVVDLARDIASSEIVVVVGESGPQVRKLLGDSVRYAVQSVPRGTGDAVQKGLAVCRHPNILILSGDVPLLQKKTILDMIGEHTAERAALTFLTCDFSDPHGYGRVVRDRKNKVVKIVEDADASSVQKKIREVNAGIYFTRRDLLGRSLQKVDTDNRQGEYYLTDIVREILSGREKVVGFKTAFEDELVGINTQADLLRVRGLIKNRWFGELMKRGVRIEDPATTNIDLTVKIGNQVLIRPNTLLEGRTRIPEGQTVGPFVWIRDNRIRFAAGRMNKAEPQ
jgi:bifunctional UDP-N-acetylglucosamine pyrophosphorylase / glucosamine-1-phosphate N-acetyltransferase